MEMSALHSYKCVYISLFKNLGNAKENNICSCKLLKYRTKLHESTIVQLTQNAPITYFNS